jgi:hypothetical protein
MHSSPQGRNQRGGGALGLQPPSPSKCPKTEIEKAEALYVLWLSKVLRDFPFNQNQPMKLAAD